MSEMQHKIKRSELWNKLRNIISQLPIKDVDGDCMDVNSCSTEIEELVLNELLDQKNAILKLIEVEGKRREIEGWADLNYKVEVSNLNNYMENKNE